MKTILSFIFIFFVSISFSQDVKLIELEVNKLYEQYSKKRNHVIKTRLELDTLAFCQLRCAVFRRPEKFHSEQSVD